MKFLLLASLLATSALAAMQHHIVDFVEYASDSAMKVEGTQGDDIHIRLFENPTTGFRWMVASEISNMANLHLVSSEYVPASSTKNGVSMAGSGGERYLKFAINKAGAQQIELVYGKAWEMGKFADGNGEDAEINWNAYFKSGMAFSRKTVLVNANSQ